MVINTFCCKTVSVLDSAVMNEAPRHLRSLSQRESPSPMTVLKREGLPAPEAVVPVNTSEVRADRRYARVMNVVDQCRYE